MYRQVRLLRVLAVGALATLIVATAGLSPALAAPVSGSVAADGTQAAKLATPPVPPRGLGGDVEVVLRNANSPTSHRFSIDVPAGGRLLAADSRLAGRETRKDILVQDAKGVTVGAYDGAWALDAAGKSVKSTFRIEGTSLVQTVNVSKATVFPLTLGLIFSEVPAFSSPTGALSNGAVPLTAVEGFGAATGFSAATTLAVAAAFVSVPSNYVYNPALGSLHDYCTSSPDEFPAPFAANANFRGPCSRHDLCYGGGSTSKFTCDNRLRTDMRTNCAYQYGILNPLRGSCYSTADIYWAAVVVAT